MTKIALVSWSGNVGGAESFTVALARELMRQACSVAILFVGNPHPLSHVLDEAGVEYESLGIDRGRHVLLRPRRLGRAVTRLGPDGALLIQPGFLAGALRVGGYRGRIVAVNHGEPLHANGHGWIEAAKRAVDARSGSWATDVEVAVSDAVLAALRGKPHARRLTRIYNGVALDSFLPTAEGEKADPITIGWAGRMVAGKGVEDLITAADRLRAKVPVAVRIAGDGPVRKSLEALAPSDLVHFLGRVADMPGFWRSCDVAVMPSNELVESFGMAAAEAMACGVPVIASRLGALPELVRDDQTGVLYDPGDVDALIAAIERYAGDADLRRTHGQNGRLACEQMFDIRTSARRYRALFEGGPG